MLAPTDYIEGYSRDPIKYQRDHESLQNFIRNLNVRLHSNKVAESNRSLLISAILLALEQRSFKTAYSSEDDPTRLAKMIVNATLAQLEDASVAGLSILEQQFRFLPTATGLTGKTGKTNELKEIVQHIDTEVTSFIKNHKYRTYSAICTWSFSNMPIATKVSVSFSRLRILQHSLPIWHELTHPFDSI